MALTEAPLSEDLIEQAEHWVVRLASGDMVAEEMLRFEAWLGADESHRAAFGRSRALWQALEAGRHIGPTKRPARRAFVSIIAAGMAACLVIGVAVPELTVRLQASHSAPTGMVRHLTLPDGSRASLDTGAALAVRYDGNERKIEMLRGRGWFEVKHDDARPFLVTSAGGVTEDIGTAFEVTHADDRTEVAVTEGVVRVMSGHSDATLHQTQRARYRSGGVVERLPDQAESTIAAWRRGIIVVEDLPLAEAVEQVGRYRRGLTFIQADTSRLAPVSGVFRTDAPDEALDVLARTNGLKVVRWPGNIVVLKK